MCLVGSLCLIYLRLINHPALASPFDPTWVVFLGLRQNSARVARPRRVVASFTGGFTCGTSGRRSRLFAAVAERLRAFGDERYNRGDERYDFGDGRYDCGSVRLTVAV